jgi:transcriptional regulator with XRE-family HTH domain
MKDYRPAKKRATVSVGESVRILRELQEMSQNQLAEASGIFQATISAIEDRSARTEDQAAYRLNTMASHPTKFVLCLKNKGYEASLEPLKIYRLLADRGAEKHKLVRVVDESGEDYLFPASYFKPIELPAPIRRAIRAAI